MTGPIRTILAVLFVSLAISACEPGTDAPEHRFGDPPLKEVFGNHFLIGTALNANQMFERDEAGAELTRHHFNTITPENVMKWEVIHPEPGVYDFEAADQFVAFGEANDMHVVGHVLVWHSQVPDWVFRDEDGEFLEREALIERMRDHIHTVAGRYRGRIHEWEVVNEALNEDGTMRESHWYNIIGEDYVRLAFEFAREAAPDAALFYNDYSLENAPKRNGAVALVRSLQEADAPISGIGTQGHWHMDWPTIEQVDSTLAAFSELGIDVMVTELDIDILPQAMDYQGADVSIDVELEARLNPYADGLPDERQQELADRYAELFDSFVRHSDAITRVTFWGVSDGDSWKNNWPVRGRTSYPLLFGRNHEPKPAFHSVIDVAE